MKTSQLILSLAMLIMTSTTTTGEAPLLNRELFFGNPQISGGQLSPDGRFISFMKAYNGIMNVWVKEFAEPFEAARPLTDSQRPLYGYAWTDDGRYILYVKDKDGDENMNLFAVDPAAPPTADRKVPESRNLTPLDKVTAQIVHVSQKNPDLIWVGLNDRDEKWHDLYLLKISSGERTLVYQNVDRISGYEFDWDDNLRLVSRTDEKGTTTLLRKKGDQLEPIYETLVTEGSAVLGWDPKNENFYLETNKGDLNLSTLFLMNPDTKQLKLLESDPENRVDFGSLLLDRNTREIINTEYTDDRTRIYWKNSQWEENHEFLKTKFPGREIALQSFTNDYSKFLVAVHGDKYAADAWFFDVQTRQLIHQYTPRPELKAVEEHLAAMSPVRYPSSDGLEIPGYLTLPVGVEAKNLPTVILVHGGPKGPRDLWGYNPEAQFLANRGYAVLQPNFRASGGYGKKFLNAGDLQWGKLMQDDITWGVQYLISRGISDKDRVAIMGGSYGGYATLAGLAFTPDIYACGVDIVGPSNIATLLDSIPAYWESGRAFLYGMVGDPNTEEGAKRIREASPLFSADKIEKPLLIIQGANDPRVKQAESDQIVIALRDHGHDVSYLLAEDEGHGFAKPVNRMAMYAEVERFLADKLGGRYDAVMPQDVAERLKELRVDPASVTYTDPSQVQVAERLPKLNVQLQETTEQWEVTLSVQGQEIPMKAQRTYKRLENQWIISDSINGPLGNMLSVGKYSKDLTPIERTFEQSETVIKAQFSDGVANVEIGPQKQAVKYQGALLCNGPGQEAIVRALPLEPGYEIVVNMIELDSAKIESHRLTVGSLEKVDGQELLKVTISSVTNPAQKTTLWLDPTTKVAQRSDQVIPAMGNAVLTKKLIQ